MCSRDRTGPMAHKPGFASACEAMAGLRHVNGFPGGPSVRLNLSLGDTLAGTQAAMGTLLALLARERGLCAGQTVDASIIEAVFSVMEGVLPEYSGNGAVRGPSGTSVSGIVPTGTYPCADGSQVVIGANSDSLFKRLSHCIGQPEMSSDPAYDSNAKRVQHQAMIDGAIAAWTSAQPSASAVCALMDAASIPNGKIFSIADIHADEHCRARGMFECVNIDEGSVGERSLEIPAVSPKLSHTPGSTRWPGRSRVGADTEEVLRRVLQKSEQQVQRLVRQGVVSCAPGSS
eukprot:TRINITY_DN3710_c0_g1_i1.p1 TRINITY_DN3710_c0_g1~~TRINITY_DN3710_c0_g1_i1.p1  ORF type:complete len:289 (+),score=61.55 TRINITY_DN3710_c0_g1_i1:2-868(+)